jgi:hypothetical protein
MVFIENPPSITEETKWMYAQLQRLADKVSEQEVLIDSLKEQVDNSNA